MKFGQKLIVKKEWKYNSYLTFKKGDELYVANYEYKYGMSLHHDTLKGFINFEWQIGRREETIAEFFDVVEAENILVSEREREIIASALISEREYTEEKIGTEGDQGKATALKDYLEDIEYLLERIKDKNANNPIE